MVEAARELRAAGRAFALTLVVEAEGSTYRKPGALALVADDGRRVGVISGGCLEPGLVELARAALAAREPRDTLFDTRDDDDLIFGSGSGCRGRMRVVAWPVLPDQPAPMLDVVLALDASRRAVRVPLAPQQPPPAQLRHARRPRPAAGQGWEEHPLAEPLAEERFVRVHAVAEKQRGVPDQTAEVLRRHGRVVHHALEHAIFHEDAPRAIDKMGRIAVGGDQAARTFSRDDPHAPHRISVRTMP